MTAPTKTWQRVEKDVERLGTDVRQHFADVNTKTSEEREALEQSVRALLSAVEDSVTATGKALRDPRLCQDVTNIAASLREALRTTFESAGVQVRERISSRPAKSQRTAKAAPRATTKRARATAANSTHTDSAPRTPRKRAAS